MSLEQRRTKLVYSVIQELVEEGKSHFLPGDVNSALRRQGQPLGTWEVRGEFSVLKDQGLITVNSSNGNWTLTASDERKTG